MSDFRDVTFGEHLFSRIDDNVYLQKLYHNILINYSRRLFHLDEMEEQPVNIGDALTFADVLSKSCGTNLSDIHKTRAQEMVALLYDIICNVGCTARSFENKWSRNTIAAVRKTTEIGSYTSP